LALHFSYPIQSICAHIFSPFHIKSPVFFLYTFSLFCKGQLSCHQSIDKDTF